MTISSSKFWQRC